MLLKEGINLTIKTNINKIKPAISVVSFLSGMLIFSLLEENITHMWEGIGITLIAIGASVYLPWTLCSQT
ncbi:MAG: hypothetical protein KAI67_04705 [Candidatus Pacebacteria bacterium]|nr:hypothetical protein [Candidatus Paceibacterota bacterium]